MSTKKILIAGGGPAGIMAAIKAGQLGAEVTLVEKNNSLGRKLLLTGNCRCNLTNTRPLEKFIESFFSGGQFLRDAFKAMSNRDLIRFFEAEGTEFKVEEGGKVFPSTDRSSTILQVLDKKLQESRVKILYGKHIEDVIVRDGKVVGAAFSDGTGIIECDRLIIATGGLSYSETGSTGDGFRIAKELGHKVVPTRPGLVPLEADGAVPGSMEGLALKDVRLVFSDGKKKLLSEKGDVMFTGSGLTGPIVISMSGKIVDWASEGKKVHVSIDVKPDLAPEQVDAYLLKTFVDSPNKFLKNILKEKLPERLVDVMVELGRFDPSRKGNQVTHKERSELVSMLKGFRLEIKGGRAIEEAMITRGGVSLKEIDPRTMQSRRVKGLYFAGEVLDVDGDTGGFNLQAAFSTGALAGASAAGE